MTTCGTCKYRDESGYCVSPKLVSDGGQYTAEERDEMLVYGYHEGGGFQVGANFGCIPHEINAP